MNTPPIIGFVEAVTETAVLGWAWSPAAPDEALVVELRLADEVIARGAADRLREDLRSGGVGDGRHAFELPIEEAWRGREAEITALATRADGVTAPLPLAPPPDSLAERLDRMQGALATLVGSQRVLHRNVQALLMGARGDGASASDQTTTELLDRLGTLETHLMRLDEHLARIAQTPARAAGHARVLVPVAALLLSAAAGSAYALVHALAG